MAVAEQIGREAEQRPGDEPQVNVAGIEELVTDPAAGSWNYSSLHDFVITDGARPQGNVILDAQGNVYGTALGGGASGDGVVFEITP
jgi:uncharacterized repeat protein (TIGR03803 family)